MNRIWIGFCSGGPSKKVGMHNVIKSSNRGRFPQRQSAYNADQKRLVIAKLRAKSALLQSTIDKPRAHAYLRDWLSFKIRSIERNLAGYRRRSSWQRPLRHQRHRGDASCHSSYYVYRATKIGRDELEILSVRLWVLDSDVG